MLLAFAMQLSAQTMHSIIFANMKEPGRERDRTAEMTNMSKFCKDMAGALGYKLELKQHSDTEFTQEMMEHDIASLKVKDDDIVILYYAGHGCNWDDDNWPHMALSDKQYWETTAYAKLREAAPKAKLTLCIASCCNMDTEGYKRERGEYGGVMDPEKVKKLFTGFEDNMSIIMSSSLRGQYTYSWTTGNNPGSIFSISLRETIYDAVSSNGKTPLDWKSILDITKEKTKTITQGLQEPQYVIELTKASSKVATKKAAKQPETTPSAEISSTYITHNVKIAGISYMEIHVNFVTHNMDQYGGNIVAFFEQPQGVPLEDTNGQYCSQGGNVCTALSFGSHYKHSRFTDVKLYIPNSEIHMHQGKHKYYLRVMIFDNYSNTYIATGNYVTFTGTL